MRHFISWGWGRAIACCALLILAACAAPAVDQPAATQTPAMSQPTMTQAPVVSQPTATQAPTSAPTGEATPPAFDVGATAERALLDHQIAAWPDRNVAVGLTALDGDYAAGISLPAGARTQYVFLQRDGDAWNVIEATGIPSSAVLEARGFPLELAEANDAYAIIDAMLARLQDPRGAGVSGIVRVDDIVGEYARATLIPADPRMMDGSTTFWRRENDSWTWLTAGTAFMPEDLRALGVPDELWVNRPQP